MLLGLVAFAGLVGDPAWSGAAAAASGLVGLGLMAVGALLVGRGLLDLGRNLTPVPRPRADARLVVSGVYAHARHPIYGGLILTAAGWSLVSTSLPALSLALVLAGFFGLKSRREEAWLVQRYEGYGDYASGTRRFVPYIF